MASTLQHRLPLVEGRDEPFTSGFLGPSPSVSAPEPNSSGVTVFGKDKAQQVIGNIYETFKIDNATFVKSDEDRQRLQFAEWLSFRSHNAPHEIALKGREPGTGVWFLEGPSFADWMQNPASLLWLHGGVGCGKTVLCASIIEKIRELRGHSSWSSLCFFYCSFQDDSRQDLGALLRLFAAQLCSKTTIPNQLQALYEECRKEYPPRTPHNEELIESIFSILKEKENFPNSVQTDESLYDFSDKDPKKSTELAAKNTYLVVDALDEIPLSEREDFFEFLQKLANLKLQQLHILVTGRTQPTIAEALVSPWLPVVMDAATVNQDIRLYVSRAIEKHKKLKRQSASTKELIRQRLSEGGNGMFRWAALQMEALKRIQVAIRDTIEAALLKLPKDLNETYARILGGIGDILHQRAFTALQWLVSSPRPMLIEELIEACMIDFKRMPVIDQDHRLTPFNIFEMLHDLITIQPMLKDDSDIEDGVHTVVIAHFSVQEFLTGKDITHSEASEFRIQNEMSQLFIARSCLIYLYNFNSFEHRHERFPLREYAWYNWERHILPEPFLTNSQVRRKAISIYKLLGTSLIASGYSFSSKMLSNWPPAVALCLNVMYLFFDWLLRICWSLSSQQVMEQNLALAVSWLPENGVDKLKDSLNTPYFFKEFDAFQDGALPGREYLYRPINFEGTNFRLLTILPALDENTAIRCRLFTASLVDNPIYDALSYTWGDFTDTREAFVEGLSFTIGANLAQLLQFVRARQELKAPRLWVDALCIKQADIEERSYMVSCMGKIFRQAQEVVVGLGEERVGDESAIRSLTLLAKNLPNSTDMENKVREKSFREIILQVDKQGVWPSVLALFRAPWWTRMWVIQEIVLAANATLFFGSLSLNFDMVDRIIRFEQVFAKILEEEKGQSTSIFMKSPQWQAARRIALTRREHRAGYPITLARALYRFGTHKCSNPRDKIFSMYGIMEGQDGMILPNYSVPRNILYKELALRLLRLHRRLDVLSYTSVCEPVDMYQEDTHVLSWVPSLEVTPNCLILDPGFFGDAPTVYLFTAGGADSRAIWEVREDFLMLKGIALDVVLHTSNFFPEDDYLSTNADGETAGISLDLTRIRLKSRKLQENQTAIEARWRTILADQWPPGQRLTQATLGQSKIPPRTVEEEELLLQEPGLEAHLGFICGRLFMTTKSGRVGLGPKGTSCGDIIVVMPGGAVPYILRPMESENEYTFIGECYVHGIMDGEIPRELLAHETYKYTCFSIL